MEELASLGFISVIPAILAIVLSFATKNTIVALAIACITGTTLTGLAQGTNLLETLLLGFPTLLKENLGNTSFSWVMLLNTFIGILVAYFQKMLLVTAYKGDYVAGIALGMFTYLVVSVIRALVNRDAKYVPQWPAWVLGVLMVLYFIF